MEDGTRDDCNAQSTSTWQQAWRALEQLHSSGVAKATKVRREEGGREGAPTAVQQAWQALEQLHSSGVAKVNHLPLSPPCFFTGLATLPTPSSRTC